MAHGILKDPSRRDKISLNNNEFLISKKFTSLASQLVNDWSVLYRPARRGENPFGVYYGIVWIEQLSTDAHQPGSYVLTLSKRETFDIPLRAVQREATYERSFREPGRKSPEQHCIRKLHLLEFVSIVEDCLAQPYYSTTAQAEIEHCRKSAFFKKLADESRAKFQANFPKEI